MLIRLWPNWLCFARTLLRLPPGPVRLSLPRPSRSVRRTQQAGRRGDRGNSLTPANWLCFPNSLISLSPQFPLLSTVVSIDPPSAKLALFRTVGSWPSPVGSLPRYRRAERREDGAERNERRRKNRKPATRLRTTKPSTFSISQLIFRSVNILHVPIFSVKMNIPNGVAFLAVIAA
jgi:hypothetical protein